MTNSLDDIANTLVELCRSGRAIEAVETYYSESVVSFEGRGTMGNAADIGKEAVLAKNKWFYDNHQIHNYTALGPFSPEQGSLFTVYFDIDITQNWSNERIQMKEVALYKVDQGEIVEETFMFQLDEA